MFLIIGDESPPELLRILFGFSAFTLLEHKVEHY